jgi:hypothetical protein
MGPGMISVIPIPDPDLTEIKGEISMDPVTAGFNCAAQFFIFASTPAGQQMLTDIRTLNSTINADIAKLLASIASHTQPK